MNARSSLTTPQALDVAALGDADRRAMYALYRRYYDASSWRLFAADLAAKDHALVLRDETGAVQGFSTLAVYERTFDGRPVRVIFSGDTIVDERHWGQQALAFAWLRLAGHLKAAQPDVPLYWLLISKGHRTYRYLPTFSRAFHPSPDAATAADLAPLRDFLARDRFGTAYDAAAGVRALRRAAWPPARRVRRRTRHAPAPARGGVLPGAQSGLRARRRTGVRVRTARGDAAPHRPPRIQRRSAEHEPRPARVQSSRGGGRRLVLARALVGRPPRRGGRDAAAGTRPRRVSRRGRPRGGARRLLRAHGRASRRGPCRRQRTALLLPPLALRGRRPLQRHPLPRRRPDAAHARAHLADGRAPRPRLGVDRRARPRTTSPKSRNSREHPATRWSRIASPSAAIPTWC